MEDPENLLRQLFDQAVQAVRPASCLAPFLRNLAAEPLAGRIVVVGAGKAAAAMAQVAEKILPGPIQGLVITKYGHGVPTKDIRVVEASHPVPDQAGVDATVQILEMVKPLGANDLVLVLLSGGGSALMSAPHPSIDLKTKQAITKALLQNGADISEIIQSENICPLSKAGVWRWRLTRPEC